MSDTSAPENKKPDPAKLPPPKPALRRIDWAGLGKGAGFTALVAGVVGVLLPAFNRPTLGATRSARLKWQERQNQVEKDLAAAEQIEREHKNG